MVNSQAEGVVAVFNEAIWLHSRSHHGFAHIQAYFDKKSNKLKYLPQIQFCVAVVICFRLQLNWIIDVFPVLDHLN